MWALITQIAGMNRCLDSRQMYEALGSVNKDNLKVGVFKSDLADITSPPF